MPDFGYTSIGASSQSSVTGYTYAEMSNNYTASTGDTLDTISFYTQYTAGSQVAGVGVYDVSGGVPVNLFASSTITSDGTWAWQTTGALSLSMVSGTTYAAAFHNAANSSLFYRYDTGIAGDVSYDASPSLPDPYAESGTLDRTYSVYATYTAGAGGGFQAAWAYNTSKLIGGM